MLQVEEIKQLIADDYNSQKKRLARVGQRYYEGEHDIREYRVFYYNTDGELVEDRARSNQRISHPFFTELVDQLVSFVLSNTDEIIKSKIPELQEHLNKYFDEDFWSEIAELLTGAYSKGFEYIYTYKGDEYRLKFECADSMGVVEVREIDTDDKCKYHIYWYIDRIEKGKKEIRRIQIHSDKDIYFYVQDGSDGKIVLDKEQEYNPRPNIVYKDKTGQKYGSSLNIHPFFRFDYNKKQISGLKPIKGLIDDYDLMECGLSNNLQDFDTPIHVIKGFEGNNLDELQQNIKTKKIIGVKSGGDVDIKTIAVPYEARKTKADEDKNNIYRFGMGLDTQALKDSKATTNLAIQAAYTLLGLKANKLIIRLKTFLKQNIINLVIDEINETYGTGYKVSDVYFNFKPETLVNESENIENQKVKAETKQIEINTILNVAEQIGDEEALKIICELLDLDFEELKSALDEADGLLQAKKILSEGGNEE